MDWKADIQVKQDNKAHKFTFSKTSKTHRLLRKKRRNNNSRRKKETNMDAAEVHEKLSIASC